MAKSQQQQQQSKSKKASETASKSASSSQQQNNDDESPLQAVVMGDSFDETFMPLTMDRPRCLIPLVNVPLIDYTLECLAVAQVKEVFIFCKSHVQQIRDYLTASRWCKVGAPFRVKLVVSLECASVGDALRELDAKALLKRDFILVHGDLVANVDLQSLLAQHEANKKRDKHTLMTLLTKRALPRHRARDRRESSVFIVEPKESQLMGYAVAHESHDGTDGETTDDDAAAAGFSEEEQGLCSVEAPVASRHRWALMEREKWLAHSSTLTWRYDLLDCHVDICSLQVLALFTENFDYQSIRRDFVRGVLTSDLLQANIYLHVIQDAYAVRVATPRLYDAVSRDVLARWTFPLVPDTLGVLHGESMGPTLSLGPLSTPLASNNSNQSVQSQPQSTMAPVTIPYRFMRRHVYLDRDVILSQSCMIGPSACLGAGTVVGAQARIVQSVLGAQCQVGAQAVISGAYLWRNVRVGARAKVSRSIVAEGVHIGEEAEIGEGCLIGSGCFIPRGAKLPPFGRYVRGENGMARLWPKSSLPQEQVQQTDDFLSGADTDGDEPASRSHHRSLQRQRKQREWAERLAAVSLASRFDMEFGDLGDSASEGEEDNADYLIQDKDELPFDELANFHREAYEMTRHAVVSRLSIDNCALEINSLKFACNVTFSDCLRAMIPALVAQLDWQQERDMKSATQRLFQQWAPLLEKFIFTAMDHLDVLRYLQDTCCRHAGWTVSPSTQRSLPHPGDVLLRVFAYALQILYDTDICDDQTILTWFSEPLPEDVVPEEAERMRRLRVLTRPFMDWLQESDESDETESDE